MKVYVTEMRDDCDRVMEPHVFASRAVAEQAGEDVIECELFEVLPEPVIWYHASITYTEGGVLSGEPHESTEADYFGGPSEAWWQVFPQPREYWPPRYVTVACNAPDTPETREWFRATCADVQANFDSHAEGTTSTRRELVA